MPLAFPPTGARPLELSSASLSILVRAQMRTAESVADDKGQTLTLTISGEPRSVSVDPILVSSAIGSLLLTAIGFNLPQGRVRVKLDFNDTNALLAVADEGTADGWEAALIPVRRVFEAHGAAVEIGREADGGRVFRARLRVVASI